MFPTNFKQFCTIRCNEYDHSHVAIIEIPAKRNIIIIIRKHDKMAVLETATLTKIARSTSIDSL